MTVRVLFAFVAAAVLGAAALAAQVDAGSAPVRAATLRCEYLVEPLGIGERRPRLTWTFEAKRRGEVQSAYRVIVASSPEALARREGDLWDTGTVASSAMRVEYAGAALTSRARCFWAVLVWNGAGEAGSWSESATWEMGLLEPSDWTARWIEGRIVPLDLVVTNARYAAVDGSASRDVTKVVAGRVHAGEPVVASNEALGGDPAVNVRKQLTVRYSYRGAAMVAQAAEGATAVMPGGKLAYVRRGFTVEKPVKTARLYVTALGVYDVRINERRVGNQRLAPGWTDYRRRVQYQVIDVTDAVRAGENVIGAKLAPGWFSGRAGLFHARTFYGERPALLAQLEVTFADGTVQRVATDGSWEQHDGPVLHADLMDGEVHDAREEITGWTRPSFGVGGWTPVSERDEDRTLVAQMDDPVRVLREVPAVAMTEPGPGAWTFDLGENIVGVVRLKVRAPRGTVVTLRHAEMLRPDGRVYTDNLRGAAATDVYICSGEGDEVWEPRFTFHGFRYVELTGLTSAPGLDAVTGVVLGSAMARAGEFSCSDERVNRLQANIVRGLEGNYVSIPTDCPQRDERMGWMADTQVFARTAAFNVEVMPFLSKWMVDVLDAQREDGAHSDVAPVMKGLTYGTPAWADAGTVVPWTLYEMSGDPRVLKRTVDSMVRWVEWCRGHSTGLVRDRDRGNDYGDWLAIQADTPKDLIGTAYFAHSAAITARALAVVGREEEAAKYAALAEDVRAAFVAKYVDADGRVKGDTQTGYLLALRFGLVPEDLRAKVVDRLVADIEARGDRLSTGFVGVGILLPTLSAVGRDDVAQRLLLQDEFPSWLFSVKHGATTIWERWDGWTPERGVHPDAGMNSFNHYALGSCGEWLYEACAGIGMAPGTVGFEHLLIRPRTEGPLTRASATYRSVRGEIRSSWRRDEFGVMLAVTIPGNSSATVVLPAPEGAQVLESGVPAGNAPGVRGVRREGGVVMVEVGGGEYRFEVTRDQRH
jgi:alpha-L-rhamnosidase